MSRSLHGTLVPPRIDVDLTLIVLFCLPSLNARAVDLSKKGSWRSTEERTRNQSRSICKS